MGLINKVDMVCLSPVELESAQLANSLLCPAQDMIVFLSNYFFEHKR